LLGYLVHLVNSSVHLIDALCLFLRSGGDFADQIARLTDTAYDLFENLANFACNIDAVLGVFG